VLRRIATGVIAVYLVASSEDSDYPYLPQRNSGIAQAQKMVLQNIARNSESDTFRKIAYYEHHSTVDGRRVLTAQVICGQTKASTKKGAGYRSFLSWVFLESKTGSYYEDKYIVAVHDPAHPDDPYARYHSSICADSEDGASIEANINVANYQ
jgi:hypothetical protein